MHEYPLSPHDSKILALMLAPLKLHSLRTRVRPLSDSLGLGRLSDAQSYQLALGLLKLSDAQSYSTPLGS